LTHRLTINHDELITRTGINPYLALPREEVAHFFAAVPVELEGETDAAGSTPYLTIGAVVILHFNYNWMVFGRGKEEDGELILGLRSEPFTDEAAPLFLDREFLDYTRSFLARTLATAEPLTMRMSGMHLENGNGDAPGRLNLVCVAQMKNKSLQVLDPALCLRRTMGSGELTLCEHRFDTLSRFLITKLYGF